MSDEELGHEGSQRVLLVLGTSTGGVVRHVAQVADALRSAGWNVRICGPADLGPHFEGHDFASLGIGPRPNVSDPVTIRRLAVLSRGADVVHAHGLRAGALTILANRILNHRRRTRIVVTLHNLAVGGRVTLGISRVLEGIVARGADVVLGVSMDIVDAVRRRGARHALRALVPAPSMPRGEPRSTLEARTELGIEPGIPLVLTVGRLAPQKGLDTLLDAAALLREELGDGTFAWVIAGSGPLEEALSHRIRSQSLPVRLLGARGDVADLLTAADVVVSAAVWEGQPIGIQEALRAGVALVVTDAGGTREVTGLAGASVVPVGAADRIAYETARFLTDQEAREIQKQRALSRAEELPGPREVVAQLQDVYRGRERF